MTETGDIQQVIPIHTSGDRLSDGVDVRRSEGSTRDHSRLQRRLTLGVLCAFPIIYGLVGLSLGADANWDLLNYHFVDPYWAFTNHMRDVMPAGLQTYTNPIIDLPFYLAAIHLPERVVGFSLAVIAGLSFPLLYLISRRFTSRRFLALVLAVLGMFGAEAIGEIDNIMGDTITAIFFLASVLAALYAIAAQRGPEDPSVFRRHSMQLALVAGGLAGVGAGLKLSGYPIALGIVAAFVVVTGPLRTRMALVVASGIGLLVGLLLSYGWWGFELAVKYHNPILPYMNQFFRSPYAPFASNRDPRFLPHGLAQVLFYPFYWTSDPLRAGEVSFRDLSLPILEVLLLLVLVTALVRSLVHRRWMPVFASSEERFLVWFAVVAYFIWVVEFGYYRYLVPVEMLSWVLIFVVVKVLIRDWLPRPTLTIVLATLVALTVFTEHPENWGRAPWASRYFSISVPAALRSEPSAFLMVGPTPIGYLVPFFPAQDYFARIQSNLGPTPLVKQVIERDLTAYTRVFLIWADPTGYSSTTAYVSQPDPIWRPYGFAAMGSTCITVTGHVSGDVQAVHLCGLERLPVTRSR
ncbi:MAG: hypothetical protein ACLPVF_00470 [Acidimicrobiales bacterium]